LLQLAEVVCLTLPKWTWVASRITCPERSEWLAGGERANKKLVDLEGFEPSTS